MFEVYIIYSGKDKVKVEIYEYYLNNYKSIGIKFLEESVLEKDQKGEYTNSEDGMKLLKEIYEREIDDPAGEYEEMDLLLSKVFLKLNNEKNTTELNLRLFCAHTPPQIGCVGFVERCRVHSPTFYLRDTGRNRAR